jgi:hypothetical protein
MKFTQEDLDFLSNHSIALKNVFDASGMTKKNYAKFMKDNNFHIAVGVSACKKFGHKMRTRSGHCVQCNPAYLGYQNNFNKSAFLYIAQCDKFIKIGITSNINNRKKSLNSQYYGGVNGWIIRDSIWLDNAGACENKIINLLRGYSYTSETIKEYGISQSTYEMFKCTYRIAKNKYDIVIKSNNIKS